MAVGTGEREGGIAPGARRLRQRHAATNFNLKVD